MRLLAAATLLLLFPAAAQADILIENVVGFTLDEKGRVQEFEALLVGDDGRIEQVFDRRDKRPGKVDFRMDGKGRVLIPGLIDAHAQVMELGLALLTSGNGADVPQGAPRPEDRDLAFFEAQQALLARGITTVADMGTSIEDWQSYRRAGDAGRLRIRLVSYAAGVEDMVLIGGPGPTPWLYQDKLRQIGLSLDLDGAVSTRDAWLAAPYADAPAQRGKALIGETPLRNLMSRGAIDNFQVAVRASGDAAVGATLDAIAELAETYKGERRWRIEGADLIASDQPGRFEQLGVIATVAPQDVTRWQETEARLGPARAGVTYPWKTLQDAGVVLAFGSAAKKVPPQPFAAISAAITRQDASGQPFTGWQAQERLSREAAFAGHTTGAAQALFAEGRLGRIAEGYRADFLLIDRNPFIATPEQLRDTRVLQTWVNGELVFEAEDDGLRGQESAPPSR